MNVKFFQKKPPGGDSEVEYIEISGHNGKDVVSRRATEEDHKLYDGHKNSQDSGEPLPERTPYLVTGLHNQELNSDVFQSRDTAQANQETNTLQVGTINTPEAPAHDDAYEKSNKFALVGAPSEEVMASDSTANNGAAREHTQTIGDSKKAGAKTETANESADKPGPRDRGSVEAPNNPGEPAPQQDQHTASGEQPPPDFMPGFVEGEQQDDAKREGESDEEHQKRTSNRKKKRY